MLISLHAQEVYTTKNIPKVHLQDKTRYVCNPAGILSASACDEIDRMLYALEQQTGIETVVAVVPSIGNEDCFDFSHRLLNEWGVGKKEKNSCAHQLQQCCEELQYSHSTFSEEHPCRSFRF